MIANWAVCFFTSVGVPTVPSLDFPRICLNWSGLETNRNRVGFWIPLLVVRMTLCLNGIIKRLRFVFCG